MNGAKCRHLSLQPFLGRCCVRRTHGEVDPLDVRLDPQYLLHEYCSKHGMAKVSTMHAGQGSEAVKLSTMHACMQIKRDINSKRDMLAQLAAYSFQGSLLRQWWGCPCSWSTQGSSCLFPPLFQPSYFFNRYLPVFVCEKERSDAREKAGREKDAASLVLEKKFMWSLMRGTARTQKEGPDVGIYGAQCSRPPTKSRVEYTKSMTIAKGQHNATSSALTVRGQTRRRSITVNTVLLLLILNV